MAMQSTLLRQLKTTKSSPNPCLLKGYIDTLYDYTAFLNGNTTTGVDRSKKVAIVGAGVAGMVAAYNLMQAGIVPDVYEAWGGIGGRTASVPFPSNPKAFAELGAMRIPCGEEIFWHYYSKFNLPRTPDFPNPGKVNTQIYFQNTLYNWNPSTSPTPPGPFKKINNDWNNFLNPIVDKVFTPWQKGDLNTVKKVWQQYINTWKNVSFYAALVKGIPQWTTADLTMFGALGVGSGGFGPLYQVNFLEILRLILNRLETDLKMIPLGVTDFTKQFASYNGLKPKFFFKTAVKRITRFTSGPNNGKIVLDLQSRGKTDTVPSIFYDAVIVATNAGPMELMGLTLPQPSASQPGVTVDVLQQNAKNAVRNLHIERSSKLFILTKDKFWKKIPGQWANIQTDELFFGMYTLDYPQIDNGVVLLSYTWADNSTRLLALNAQERLEHFKSIAEKVNPDFAKHLVPVTPKDILMVDWQNTPFQNGAFKLNYPGQEPYCRDAYFQFQTANYPRLDTGVYLAGDAVSWSGGWIEGALQTGINAATAVLKRFGGRFSMKSPLEQDAGMYQY